ncbi:hypothetical protein [uncultured Roseivirga sp.]|uniref:hypothetical protein n=1 Tax=uncultured Roseivirga sp. TaxID=543088 RepID=UPI0025841181|nr:hypothetical protein [uncultured Roseivirga sp.]|tara:strand:+ start:970 stop:1656 length:687 start_codon:yes stop_codon:yes gene_type:complete
MLINLSKRLICLTFGLLIIFSCSPDELPIEIPFYFYDFESDYTNIDSLYVSSFNGSNVLGPFNNSGFSVHWNNLPDHEYIKLSFDLYIHDSWEGNSNQSDRTDPDHDAWIIELDPHKQVKPHEKIYFETTFSNGLCIPGWCYSQSFPNEFPFDNEARTGAASRKIYGRCLWADTPTGTSVYEIEKVFPHDKRSVVIAFYDRLKQDLPFDRLCEESWSMDNLRISLIKE